MFLNTREHLASIAAKRWVEQHTKYKHLSECNNRDIHTKLCSLGLKPKPEEVDAIIGNNSWTRITCDECKTEVRAAVIVGGNGDSVTLCKNCILTALDKIREVV